MITLRLVELMQITNSILDGLENKIIPDEDKFLNTFVTTFAPALSKAFVESYSQFVPGNTGINTVG